jgi:5-methylcytosine-specific restriction protein A
MRTFLLAWNPHKWSEEYFSEYVEDFHNNGRARGSWSVGQRRDLPVGSRLFLVRVGDQPKGLIASGWARSTPAKGPHWDQAEAESGKTRWGIEVEFDYIQPTPVLPIDDLKDSPFDEAVWLIQGSGVELQPNVAAALEARWAIATHVASGQLPEEVSNQSKCPEGAKKQITVNAYERNPKARELCIKFHGPCCCVCGISFGDVYGDSFRRFIHVHHLTPVSKMGGSYEVDPRADLRPVCPNCHSVMHLKKPPYSVEEVQQLMAAASALKKPSVGTTKAKGLP